MKLLLCNTQHKLTYVSLFRSSHQRPEDCNFIKKETLAQVLSCEFFEISKNNFFYRTRLDDCFCLFYLFWSFQTISQHFLRKIVWNFQHLSGISDKYVLHFNFIIICKKQRLQHDSNNSNTSSHNSESETELPDFSTLKLFDMEPKKSFITAAVNVVGFVNRLKRTEAVVRNVLQNMFLKMFLKRCSVSTRFYFRQRTQRQRGCFGR